MKIRRVAATVHRPAPAGEEGERATYAGADGPVFVRLRVETEEGIVGNGFTGRFLAAEVAHFLSGGLAEAARGADPLDAGLAERLARRFNPRAMTGVVVSALSAFDIALHDIRGKAAGKPIAELLGGLRRRVPVHVTCGLPHLDLERLVAVCRAAVLDGSVGIKVIVAAKGRAWEDDADRLAAVREAIGPGPELIADANCGFDIETARRFAERVAPLDLAWLEEPVRDNDPADLAMLARDGHCRLGAGQMEQSAFRFRALMDEGRIAVVQPNAVFAGGVSAAIEVAAMARSRGRRVAPAGGWDFVNLHLMAGAVADGAMEFHHGQEAILRAIAGEVRKPVAGHLVVPDRPGIGIEIDEERLAATRI